MVEQHMIILSGGDSFTYGNELSDDNPHTHSNNTWSANLAKHFGFGYESVAKPGAGNDYISRSIITRVNQLRKQDKKFVVAVMWTYPGRIELKVQGEWHQLNDYVFWDSMEKLKQQWPNLGEKFYQSVLDKIQRNIDGGYQNLFRDFMKFTVLTGDYAITNSYKSIFATAQYLKYHHIPFFFVNAVDNNVHIDSASIDFLPYMESMDYTDWLPVPSFYNWAQDNKYKFGSAHPLDHAHTDYAELILKTGLVETKWQLK